MLKPGSLEHHALDGDLATDPVAMPLSLCCMTESLHVLQNDHVALALRFSSVAGTTTPRSQVWTLSAGSHGEAKQWLDALAALGVPASCASGSGGIVDESDRESGVGPSSCQIGCLWLRITVHSFLRGARAMCIRDCRAHDEPSGQGGDRMAGGVKLAAKRIAGAGTSASACGVRARCDGARPRRSHAACSRLLGAWKRRGGGA